MCSMRSQIHAWNMAEGEWLKRDLAQPFYGKVEHGSPIPSWILNSLIRGSLLGILCINVLDYMWI